MCSLVCARAVSARVVRVHGQLVAPVQSSRERGFLAISQYQRAARCGRLDIFLRVTFRLLWLRDFYQAWCRPTTPFKFLHACLCRCLCHLCHCLCHKFSPVCLCPSACSRLPVPLRRRRRDADLHHDGEAGRARPGPLEGARRSRGWLHVAGARALWGAGCRVCSLRYSAVFSAVQCTVLCGTVQCSLRYSAVFSVVRYSVLCGTVQCSLWYGAVFSAVQCSVLCGTVRVCFCPRRRCSAPSHAPAKCSVCILSVVQCVYAASVQSVVAMFQLNCVAVCTFLLLIVV